MALDGPERGFDSRAESCGETQMTNTDGESLFDTLDSLASDTSGFGASGGDYGDDGGGSSGYGSDSSGGFFGSDGGGESDIRDNREGDFSLSTGRFRNPETGEFERGRSPPDYDSEANRYRAENGQFKSQSADLYDEPAEVRFDDLRGQG